MSSIPYSRYLIYPVPWYSFLIVVGVVLAVFLACREERALNLPKDTVIDLALWILPCGIIGARIYYVVFSWDQFQHDFFSVFRIWEGGIAIYGGIIAGLLTLFVFCRRRHLPALLLCDAIAPGLALAQSIGRWGNWFNIEAYGRSVNRTDLCFFPLALQVPSDGYSWHFATFFYESVWDFSIFIVLLVFRRRLFRKQGDVFCFYVLLYAAGRMIIEELRVDSLYAASSVRISQLFSILLCIAVLIRYFTVLSKAGAVPASLRFFILPSAAVFSVFAILYATAGSFIADMNLASVIVFLFAYAVLMIVSVFLTYAELPSAEADNADIRI